MWDRRDFIKTTATAAAGAALASPAFAGAGAGAIVEPNQVGAVIYDPRFSDSRAFAETLMLRGARAFSTQEDIGRLWNGPLGEMFAAAPLVLAGMTPHTDLFISQAFAGEIARGKVTFEAMHDSRGAQALAHSFDMPADQRGLGEAVSASGRDWPRLLAQRLAAMTPGAAPRLHELAASESAADDHPGTLFSWVIARAPARALG
jgi:hypothetical protein